MVYLETQNLRILTGSSRGQGRPTHTGVPTVRRLNSKITSLRKGKLPSSALFSLVNIYGFKLSAFGGGVLP